MIAQTGCLAIYTDVKVKAKYGEKIVNDFGSLGIVRAGFTFLNNKINYIASLIKN